MKLIFIISVVFSTTSFADSVFSSGASTIKDYAERIRGASNALKPPQCNIEEFINAQYTEKGGECLAQIQSSKLTDIFKKVLKHSRNKVTLAPESYKLSETPMEAVKGPLKPIMPKTGSIGEVFLAWSNLLGTSNANSIILSNASGTIEFPEKSENGLFQIIHRNGEKEITHEFTLTISAGSESDITPSLDFKIDTTPPRLGYQSSMTYSLFKRGKETLGIEEDSRGIQMNIDINLSPKHIMGLCGPSLDIVNQLINSGCRRNQICPEKQNEFLCLNEEEKIDTLGKLLTEYLSNPGIRNIQITNIDESSDVKNLISYLANIVKPKVVVTGKEIKIHSINYE